MRRVHVDVVRACQIITTIAVFVALLLPGASNAWCVQTAQTKPPVATQDDPDKDKKISGLGIILKGELVDGGRIFQVDGYRVRIRVPGSTVSLNGSLKSIVDITPGNWVRFEGARDEAGVVNAETAEFYPAGTRTGLTAMGPKKVKNSPDYQQVTHNAIIDGQGNLLEPGKKVRMSDSAGPCGWHRVPADTTLQERVKRIGMRLVPEYQRQLAEDVPARIPFRFYAVEDSKVRSEFSCSAGLVLVPKNVVERIQNDDQLAAVLADGIAFSLIDQLNSFSALDAVQVGAEAALFSVWLPVWAGGMGTEMIAGHAQVVKLEQESGRIALQLMEDAGYDPWKAPEAWRRLDPKELPKDIQSLECTRKGKYQLNILKLQYKQAADLAGEYRMKEQASPDEKQ